MPFIGASLSTTMVGLLAGKGFVGPDVKKLTDACGLGSQLSIVGKTFSTIDTGTIPGTGVGTGVGLIIQAPLVTAAYVGQAAGAGFVGPNVMDVGDAFGQALQITAAQATLISMHTTVFVGTGIVVPGSVGTVESEWGSNIFSQGTSLGLLGQDFQKLGNALAAGGAAAMALAIGTVVIAGAPTGIPVPGAGTGTGNIL